MPTVFTVPYFDCDNPTSAPSLIGGRCATTQTAACDTVLGELTSAIQSTVTVGPAAFSFFGVAATGAEPWLSGCFEVDKEADYEFLFKFHYAFDVFLDAGVKIKMVRILGIPFPQVRGAYNSSALVRAEGEVLTAAGAVIASTAPRKNLYSKAATPRTGKVGPLVVASNGDQMSLSAHLTPGMYYWKVRFRSLVSTGATSIVAIPTSAYVDADPLAGPGGSGGGAAAFRGFVVDSVTVTPNVHICDHKDRKRRREEHHAHDHEHA